MFLLVAGRAQSRSRVDEPIRTQRDRSRSQEKGKRTKHRSERESDSSNNYSPIIIGPLTTNQELIEGEKVYNLPLMIQQPFLREKKEPIKVDISVKLISKPRKREKKKRNINDVIEEKGVENSISMEVTEGNVHVLKETADLVEQSNVNQSKNDCDNCLDKFDDNEQRISGPVLTDFDINKTAKEGEQSIPDIEMSNGNKNGPMLENLSVHHEEILKANDNPEFAKVEQNSLNINKEQQEDSEITLDKNPDIRDQNK